MNVDHRFTQTQKQYAADDLETMSEAKRYQAHVFDLLRPYIGSSVLEVGCGIGTTSLRLAEIAERLVCIEPNLNCVSRARAALDGNPKISLRICHLEECDRGELIQQRFDTIVCVNVLEHIEDDAAEVRTARDLLKAGGYLLVIVPAHPSLFSPIDEKLLHYRRYSRASLLRLVEKVSGFEVVECRYINKLGVAGWLFNKWRGTAHQSRFLFSVFDKYFLPVSRALDHVAPKSFGLSLFVVLRKI